MSILSDEKGYGEIIDRYFDAYARLAVISASPVSESGYLAAVKAELTGDIPIEQVYDFDKTNTNIAQYVTGESTELNLLMDDLKPTILEYLNAYSGITKIFSRDKSLAIVPVDSENFDVETWP